MRASPVWTSSRGRSTISWDAIRAAGRPASRRTRGSDTAGSIPASTPSCTATSGSSSTTSSLRQAPIPHGFVSGSPGGRYPSSALTAICIWRSETGRSSSASRSSTRRSTAGELPWLAATSCGARARWVSTSAPTTAPAHWSSTRWSATPPTLAAATRTRPRAWQSTPLATPTSPARRRRRTSQGRVVRRRRRAEASTHSW